MEEISAIEELENDVRKLIAQVKDLSERLRCLERKEGVNTKIGVFPFGRPVDQTTGYYTG